MNQRHRAVLVLFIRCYSISFNNYFYFYIFRYFLGAFVIVIVFFKYYHLFI